MIQRISCVSLPFLCRFEYLCREKRHKLSEASVHQSEAMSLVSVCHVNHLLYRNPVFIFDVLQTLLSCCVANVETKEWDTCGCAA